jgi:pantoate--beta-alanine ligase
LFNSTTKLKKKYFFSKKDFSFVTLLKLKPHKIVEIFTKSIDLERFTSTSKIKGQTIGFVPTMGALHEGHISLLLESKKKCEISVVSIFVNPTQFNNPTDFKKYPIQIDQDLEFLKNNSCDVVFIPSKEEIYTESYSFPKIDIGFLGEVLEGKYRPGHFDGVMQVVYRLFELVKPDKAFFGLKDFQQLAVIKKMTDYFNLPIEIVACNTIREKDGLAMSSRNQRLKSGERLEALFIYESMLLSKNLASKFSPAEVKKIMEDLYANSSLKLEYFEIIDPIKFETLTLDWVENSTACIVAYVGEVRLIDNMLLN